MSGGVRINFSNISVCESADIEWARARRLWVVSWCRSYAHVVLLVCVWPPHSRPTRSLHSILQSQSQCQFEFEPKPGTTTRAAVQRTSSALLECTEHNGNVAPGGTGGTELRVLQRRPDRLQALHSELTRVCACASVCAWVCAAVFACAVAHLHTFARASLHSRRQRLIRQWRRSSAYGVEIGQAPRPVYHLWPAGNNFLRTLSHSALRVASREIYN